MGIESDRSQVCSSRPLVICDDHTEIRQALRRLLTQRRDVTIVGEAWDNNTCEAAIRTLTPEVLILDVNIPGGGGVVATKLVKSIAPRTLIIAYSGRHEPSVQEAMRSAGADEFVVKTGRIRPLIDALDRALEGGRLAPR